MQRVNRPTDIISNIDCKNVDQGDVGTRAAKVFETNTYVFF